MRPIPMTVGSDNGRARLSSIARLVNLYPEKSSSQSENGVALISTPGLESVFNVADEGGIVGGIEMPDASYFCTRKGLYQISYNGYVKRATLSLAGTVSMAHNGKIIMMVDGYKAYAFSLDDNLLTEVDIPRSHTVAFSDGYFIVSYINSNQFAVSNLYGTTFDPLQYAAAEGSPDNIQGIAVYKRQLYIPGQKSFEIWYDSGEDFPFNPNPSAYMDIGCYTPWSFASGVNGVCWLGDDKVVYLATGYTPQRISTHAIEYQLGLCDCSDAKMVTYSSEGHDFYVICLKKANKMFCFDATTQAWHERESPLGVYSCIIPLGSDNYVGMDNGILYRMNADIGTEDNKVVERLCVTPTVSNNGDRFRVSAIEMAVEFFNTKMPEKLNIDMTDAEKMINVKQGFIGMSYTDDDGKSWANEALAFPSISEGKYRWHKLGMSYRRAFKFRYVGLNSCVWSGVSIG